jgi:hypothetical protein
VSDTRSRSGILVGLAGAAGAFGAAAMMSAATAPMARADDFTDVINNVDTVLNAAQTDFTNAFTDFGSSDVNDGLAEFFSGVDNDFVTAPGTLEVGSLELLANDPLSGPIDIVIPPETTYASGLAEAENIFSVGQAWFSDVPTELSSGDYATAVDSDVLGSFYDVASLQILLEGVVASF